MLKNFKNTNNIDRLSRPNWCVGGGFIRQSCYWKRQAFSKQGPVGSELIFNFLQYHCRCHEKQIVDVTKSTILDVTKSMIVDVKKSMIVDVTKSMTVDVKKSIY